MNGGDLYELAKILGHSNIELMQRYAKLAWQHITRTSNAARKMERSFERATPKVKVRKIDVRILFAREIFTRFLAVAKLLKYWWPGTESNRRRRPFQGRLPNRGSGLKSTDLIDYNELTPAGL
jgi:hypothetical protein